MVVRSSTQSMLVETWATPCASLVVMQSLRLLVIFVLTVMKILLLQYVQIEALRNPLGSFGVGMMDSTTVVKQRYLQDHVLLKHTFDVTYKLGNGSLTFSSFTWHR